MSGVKLVAARNASRLNSCAAKLTMLHPLHTMTDHPCTACTAGTSTAPAASLQKDITFSGLTAELYSNAEDDSAPEQPEVTSSDLTTSTSALKAEDLEREGADSDMLIQDSRRVAGGPRLGARIVCVIMCQCCAFVPIQHWLL